MYVCMYDVCMYACMHAFMYISMYVCAQSHRHTLQKLTCRYLFSVFCMLAGTHSRMYTCIYACATLQKLTCRYLSSVMYAGRHTFTHAYMYTCIHTLQKLTCRYLFSVLCMVAGTHSRMLCMYTCMRHSTKTHVPISFQCVVYGCGHWGIIALYR